MFDGLGELLKVFELKTKYIFVIWFPGAFLLFAPVSWIERLGLSEFLNSYRGWIGLVTIIFFVFWCVSLYSDIRGVLKNKNEKKQDAKDFEEYKEKILSRMNSLSDGERFLLLYALFKGQQVVYSNFTNRYAQGLVRKGLLVASGSASITDFPFQIPDFVWEVLQESKNNILPQTEEDNYKFKQICDKYDYASIYQRNEMFG